MTIFLDAGPALNFLATSNQNILIQVAAAKGSNIHVPERVEREILGKAHLMVDEDAVDRCQWGSRKKTPPVPLRGGRGARSGN